MLRTMGTILSRLPHLNHLNLALFIMLFPLNGSYCRVNYQVSDRVLSYVKKYNICDCLALWFDPFRVDYRGILFRRFHLRLFIFIPFRDV